MSGLEVRCNGVTLSGLAPTGDLSFSTNEHGPLAAKWRMSLPVGFTHPALVQGARVQLMAGTWCFWSGILAEPDRTSGEFIADGLHRAAERFLNVYLDSTTWKVTTTPDQAVDAAIAAGAPFTRPASISTSPLSTELETDVQPATLAALLDQFCELNGKGWRVDQFGRLTVYDAPTVPTWAVAPGTATLPTADDDYNSTTFVRYVSATTGTPPEPSAYTITPATNATSASRWGVRQGYEDVTSLGLVSSTQGQAIAQAILDANRVRPAYTQGLSLAASQISTLGGSPAELWQVEAGIHRVRQNGVLSVDGASRFGGTEEWVVGTTEVDVTEGRIAIAPRGLLPRTAAAVAAERAKAVTPFK